MPLPRPTLLFLLPAMLLGGCWHTQSADTIGKNGGLYNKFVPAEKTTIIGTTVAVNAHDAYAIIERNRAAFPAGAFLVARDASQNPTAVLETTKQAGRTYPSQAVMIVSGQLKEGDEVVQPGPELAKLVQQNIDQYLVDHSKPAAPTSPTEAPAMVNGTVPAAPATTTTPAPAPAASTTPTLENPMPATPPAP